MPVFSVPPRVELSSLAMDPTHERLRRNENGGSDLEFIRAERQARCRFRCRRTHPRLDDQRGRANERPRSLDRLRAEALTPRKAALHVACGLRALPFNSARSRNTCSCVSTAARIAQLSEFDEDRVRSNFASIASKALNSSSFRAISARCLAISSRTVSHGAVPRATCPTTSRKSLAWSPRLWLCRIACTIESSRSSKSR